MSRYILLRLGAIFNIGPAGTSEIFRSLFRGVDNALNKEEADGVGIGNYTGDMTLLFDVKGY